MTRSLKAALGAIAVLALLMGLVANSLPNRFVVENQTGQRINSLEVRVCGKTYRFSNIDPGAKVRSRFTIRGDDHFAIVAHLGDGTTCESDEGYVTGGMYGHRHSITIKPRGAFDYADRRGFWGV